MPKMILDWKTTHDFMKDAFIGVGVPADDAEIVVDVLLESDKCVFVAMYDKNGRLYDMEQLPLNN